jgi:NAD(P)-dependent dehydrogenase (short-subunit alcohol dehydrogenase family)
MTDPARDLDGRVCVVTGAASGLGHEVAVALARRGAVIAAVARDADRAEAARAAIGGRAGSDAVEAFACDLSSQRQVRALAARLAERRPRIDLLLHAAAAVYARPTRSEDGIEMQLAVNHLAPFLLTDRLLGPLRVSDAGHVVTITSRAHARARLDLDDPNLERGYSTFRAYDRSKLANVLFTYELARRLAGTRVRANCVQPGLVRTGIGYKHTRPAEKLLWWAMSRLGRGPERAARPVVALAASSDPDGPTGCYFSGGRPARSSRASRDEALARRLWELSEALTS